MDNFPAKELADKVAASILRSNLTKAHVAREAGIPYTTFQRKINGHVEFTFSELLRIAEVTGTAPSKLIPNAFKPKTFALGAA